MEDKEKYLAHAAEDFSEEKAKEKSEEVRVEYEDKARVFVNKYDIEKDCIEEDCIEDEEYADDAQDEEWDEEPERRTIVEDTVNPDAEIDRLANKMRREHRFDLLQKKMRKCAELKKDEKLVQYKAGTELLNYKVLRLNIVTLNATEYVADNVRIAIAKWYEENPAGIGYVVEEEYEGAYRDPDHEDIIGWFNHLRVAVDEVSKDIWLTADIHLWRNAQHKYFTTSALEDWNAEHKIDVEKFVCLSNASTTSTPSDTYEYINSKEKKIVEQTNEIDHLEAKISRLEERLADTERLAELALDKIKKEQP